MASTKAASSRLRKAYPVTVAGAPGSACAISGVTMVAVPAAAAPPTTAVLRKSRRSNPEPLTVVSFMVASLPAEDEPLGHIFVKHAAFGSVGQAAITAEPNHRGSWLLTVL